MTLKEYLLVTVDGDKLDQLHDDLEKYPGVTDVSDHGGGCCCKNCPWDGNHGWPS